ncbi:MAG TPA: arsenate reductase family protein [Arcobacter sp.]|jgi:nitrogenase-associated protein|nr:arsenate reductase family protein [Arcobacter sp.]
MIFYEKTGCTGNKKQKELLIKNGIDFETRSLLDTKWNKKTLESFFEGLELHEIINQFAPKIKHNEIDLTTISKDKMIELMISEPILIKRPLIEIGTYKICGFDIDKINNYLLTNLNPNNTISVCQSETPCKSV